MTDNELLARVAEALEPLCSEVLIVGGWAQRLLLLHPLVSRPAPALATNDIDVLFARAHTVLACAVSVDSSRARFVDLLMAWVGGNSAGVGCGVLLK